MSKDRKNDPEEFTAIRLFLVYGQSFSAGYNGDGHRLFKTQDGTTTRFVLDQATPLTQVLVENDDNNQAQNYYIHGHGLVQQIDASDNSSYFYHFDHVGSTTAMTDSSQNIIAGYNYAAYGRTKASTAHYNPFQYVGRWGIMDDNNGLHHMRARYYDQRTSRFLSQDSVLGVPTSPQTLGRYAYGLGNPYSNIDPSGRTFKNLKDSFIDAVELVSFGLTDRLIFSHSTELSRLFNIEKKNRGINTDSEIYKSYYYLGGDKGHEATKYYAQVVDNEESSTIKKKAAYFAGSISSLWTTESQHKTAATLVTASLAAPVASQTLLIPETAASSSVFGHSSRLFGRMRFGQQGALNSNNTIRVGWGYVKNKSREVFRISWAKARRGNYWNHIDF